jgi:hypothetical protein
MEAVKQDGLALQYVKNQTPEICAAAIENFPEARQYVNRTDCLKAADRIIKTHKQAGLNLDFDHLDTFASKVEPSLFDTKGHDDKEI